MEKNYVSWPQGVCKHLSYPEIPVFQVLRSSAARWPERNAMIFGGMEITFRELDLLTDRFAAALADQGVKKGDRVGVHLPNCPQFAIAYFGLLKAGAVFVPLSPLLSERELAFQLDDAGVETYIGLDLISRKPRRIISQTPVKRIILTGLSDCYPRVTAPVKALRRMPLDEEAIDFSSLLEQYPEEAPSLDFEVKEDLAHITYTGGTTGTPKGVMISHYSVVVNCCQYAQWFIGGDVVYEGGKLDVARMEGDREEEHIMRRGCEISLIVVPWFHVMGVIAFLDIQIMNGWTMIVSHRFDPEQYLRSIGKYGATGFGGAPQLFVPLVDHPLFGKADMSNIRLVVSGAAPMPVHLLERVLEKIPGVVCEGYGLTECTMGCTANPPARERIRLGSVGLPLADTEIKIVDLEAGDVEMPLGEAGEVCIRGPQVMKGYWKDPEETARVLRGGWLHTGDIGRFDADGYLYIVDRKKEMLIYKGYNVYPRELEEVINGHPAVSRSVVVGKRDERYGELPVAFVELLPGATAGEEELREYANLRLARYKRIRILRIVDDLTNDMEGGLAYKELREKADAMDERG
ncbi:MAG: acyl-CoA synthetase [Actinobacteria bacterium]|jgi:long-chain acyl-CoA synthetase|nr:MAG: acyl-CoA synthetase [Actinomycetota bacterium]